MEKCAYHDELKLNVDRLTDVMGESLQRQSAWQVSLDNVVELLRELREEQKKLTEVIGGTVTFVHRDFVTKREFELFEKITRDDLDSMRKGSLKAMAITFGVGATALAFIQWVIGLIIGG